MPTQLMNFVLAGVVLMFGSLMIALILRLIGSNRDGRVDMEVGFGWKDIIGFQVLMLIPGITGRMQLAAATTARHRALEHHQLIIAAIAIQQLILAFGVHHQLGATGVQWILQLMTNIVQMQGGHRRKKTKLISLGKMLFLR